MVAESVMTNIQLDMMDVVVLYGTMLFLIQLNIQHGEKMM